MCTFWLPASLQYGSEEDAYTSLSEYHDYEPCLEFDDSELVHNTGLGKCRYITVLNAEVLFWPSVLRDGLLLLSCILIMLLQITICCKLIVNMCINT